MTAAHRRLPPVHPQSPATARTLGSGVADFVHGQSAAAAVEMAVTLPVFLILVFGLIQFSIVLFTYCNAAFVCRQATRYASLHSATSLAPATTAQVQALATSELFLSPKLTPTVTVYYTTTSLAPTPNNTVGNYVWVTASWSESTLIPFLPRNSYTITTRDLRLITR
jgi:Flp pilus assembly protein TadG